MKWIVLFIALALTSIMIGGCYTEQKASGDVDKAFSKYPVMVAQKTRNLFPCITTEFDSTQYLKDIKSLQETLRFADSVIDAGAGQNFELERLLDALKLDSSEVRDSVVRVFQLCSEVQKENKQLKQSIAAIRSQPPPAPVVKHIRDDAAVFEARDEKEKMRTERDNLQGSYNELEKKYKDLQDRVKGKILIPWWWLLVALGIGLLAKYGSRILSLIKLIK